MKNFQLSLFYDIEQLVLTSSFYRKYDAIFRSLPNGVFVNDCNGGVGRTGYCRSSFVKAFVVMHLEEIKSVPRLIEFLDAHPVLTEMCGFSMGNIPDNSQFYRFLGKTKNSTLQSIMHQVITGLIDQGIVSMDTLMIDSKAIMAASKENNFKNPTRNSMNKQVQPKRNPQATLHYYSHEKLPEKKKITLFWGYRTHVIVSKEGIPLVETTLPNNQTDEQVAKRLIRKLRRLYPVKKGCIFIADSGYDAGYIYELVRDQLKGKAYIPMQKRAQKPPHKLGPNNAPLCEAEIEMIYTSSWTDGNRKKTKFRCPIKTNANMAERCDHQCPVNHIRFNEGAQYGCTKYLQTSDHPRYQLHRNTDKFKKIYRQRTTVERYFSRLGDREVEQTTHYKLKVVKNQMTIAHLSMSLVAAAAAIILKRPEKIRCYRTLAQAA